MFLSGIEVGTLVHFVEDDIKDSNSYLFWESPQALSYSSKTLKWPKWMKVGSVAVVIEIYDDKDEGGSVFIKLLLTCGLTGWIDVKSLVEGFGGRLILLSG